MEKLNPNMDPDGSDSTNSLFVIEEGDETKNSENIMEVEVIFSPSMDQSLIQDKPAPNKLIKSWRATFDNFGRDCMWVMRLIFALLWTLWITCLGPPMTRDYSLSAPRYEDELIKYLSAPRYVELIQPQITRHVTRHERTKIRMLKRWELKLKPVINLLLVLNNQLTCFAFLFEDLHFSYLSLAYRNNEKNVLSVSKMCNSLGLAAIRAPSFVNQAENAQPVRLSFNLADASLESYNMFLNNNLQ